MSACVVCSDSTPPPEWFGPRAGEHHVGVHLGDGGLGWRVLFNGFDVTMQTREAVAGDHGWVQVYLLDENGRRRGRGSGRGLHACTVFLFGRVSVGRLIGRAR